MLDQPTNIRQGEALDTDKLRAYLTGIDASYDADFAVRQFPSGFSNLTYWVKIGDTEYVLRRPPFGASAKGGHDMFREYRVMRDLYPVFPQVPKMYHYCDNEEVMGAPFYLMERVEGVIIRKGSESAQLSAESYQQVAKSWLDTFIALHQVDYEAAGLGDLGRPVGYNERQVVGWSKRYQKAKTHDVATIDAIIKWLNERIPVESGSSLIHNDYKYDNIVFPEGDWSQVKAILDWEMATLGDPLMDLGTSVAYWSNYDDPEPDKLQGMLTTYMPGNPRRGDIVNMYAEKTGKEVGDFVYYYVFGLFKLAVIVQQIYYRYAKGFTQDKRFARLDQTVQYLGLKALQAVQKGKIDSLF